ncbi:FAD-dependent monooxygenase [Pendulispora albinea]|uniref:FAD-dependent monooxygenase n=1 Tax=Pendulispora albinea TaxID=2741071 RepID=A0ABZ2M1W1_9BACT
MAGEPVVVVGAGPVGLMLAGELRLGGAEVIVLEKLRAPMTESRASTLHARTMELLDSRGLLEEVGAPPNEIMGHFGGIPLDLTLPSPYPGQWKVAQTRLESILQGWALGLGADLRRGHELTGLVAGLENVTWEAVGPHGPVRGTAPYVVGCDGESSRVRSLVGADFPSKAGSRGPESPRLLLRADVAGIDIPNRRFQRLENGLAIAARRGDGITRVMVHEFGRTTEPVDGHAGFADVAGAWMRVTGEDLRSGTPLWVNAFSDASRQVARYREGRVFFAGDAAHQQMPIGGQALNLGLHDAVNLGWKLALAARGRASPELLDTYHRERYAVGDSVLSNIRAQAMLLLGGPEVEPLRSILAKLMEHEPVRTELASRISGLDIRYEVGPGPYPLRGARMPHRLLRTAAGTTTSTALLRAGRGALLVFTDDSSARELEAAAAPWAARIDVVRARIETEHPPLGTDAVLVRPDGYVLWARSEASDPIDLIAALRRWFGAPEAASRAGKPSPAGLERTRDHRP